MSGNFRMNLWSHRLSQNTNEKLSRFLPSLHRAEILTIFRSYFGRNDDFINSFWNLLTFSFTLSGKSRFLSGFHGSMALPIFFDDFTAVKTLTFYDEKTTGSFPLTKCQMECSKKITYFAAEEQFFFIKVAVFILVLLKSLHISSRIWFKLKKLDWPHLNSWA